MMKKRASFLLGLELSFIKLQKKARNRTCILSLPTLAVHDPGGISIALNGFPILSLIFRVGKSVN